MTVFSFRLLAAISALVAASACTEPRARQAAADPSPELEARLELSDASPRSGSELIVHVKLNGKTAGRVASFTERLSYDTTSLRYLGDAALEDGATRITNPTPGLIRSAGLRAAGFGDGSLIAYRFLVVDPSGVGRLRLTIDELHEQTHADAASAVRVRRDPAVRVP